MWLVWNAPLNVSKFSSVGRQHVEFLHFEAEQIRQVMRKTAVRHDVVFVHQPGVERADQRAAVLDKQFQPVGVAAGNQVQRRRKDNLVFRQILVRPREVHQDVAVMERIVDELDVLAQAEQLARLVGLRQHPFVVVRVEDADFGDNLACP